MSGPDAADPATNRAPDGSPDFAAACIAGGLAGARIGVPRAGLWGYSSAADEIAENALRLLSRAGAVIVDPADLATSAELGSGSDELTVLLYELKAGLADYLATRPGGPKSLADVIAFNAAHADREMPYFGQDLFEQAQEKGPLTDPAYRDALEGARRLGGELGIDATLRAHDLDALVAPAYPPAWKIDLVNGDHVGGACTQASAVAGYPIVTVPAGAVAGLPIGLAFLGTAWSEATLLRLAYGFEQATEALPAPSFRAPMTG
jgi:amidase